MTPVSHISTILVQHHLCILYFIQEPIPPCQSHIQTSICVSEIFPMLNSFNIHLPMPTLQSKLKKWIIQADWNGIDEFLCNVVLDDILSKVKIPLQPLQSNSECPKHENQLLVNIYAYKITHALRCAEMVAVPTRKVSYGSEVFSWYQNSALLKAC